MKFKISTLFHPVRMRIVQTLSNGEEKTAQEIAQTLSDIPPATLYRHLNKLTAERILTVVKENRIRGAVEKVYAISESLEEDTDEEVRSASREDHLSLFFNYLINLLGEYKAYLEQEDIDLERDGVSYRQLSLYLSDEELRTLLFEFRDKLQAAASNESSCERRLRTVSTIVIPK